MEKRKFYPSQRHSESEFGNMLYTAGIASTDALLVLPHVISATIVAGGKTLRGKGKESQRKEYFSRLMGDTSGFIGNSHDFFSNYGLAWKEEWASLSEWQQSNPRIMQAVGIGMSIAITGATILGFPTVL